MQTRKNHHIIFEPPTPEERRRIIADLRYFGKATSVEKLLQEKHLLVGRGRRLEVYLLSPPLWSLFQTTRSWRQPYFIGCFLGELQRDTFQPSLHICHWLSTHITDAKRVVVTPQGEQQFLYGQDIENGNIMHMSRADSSNTEVLVMNVHGEGLGYGHLTKNEEGSVLLKNHRDLGWYLRRGG